MSQLSKFLSATGNEFASIASEGIIAGDVDKWIDSGSYSFNALLSGSIYGGIPDSKVTGLAAESSAGKTFLALATLRSWQEQNPNGDAIIFESESAISKPMLEARGIDVNRVAVVPVTTIQEFRTQALRVVDAYEKQPVKERQPLFFMLDSLGMLSTSKEVEDSMSGSDTRDMTRSQLVRGAFRLLTLKLGRAGIPMVMTNHTYQNITTMYGGQEASGGGGFKYACSTIITMTKAQDKDGDEIKGSIVTCTTYKSRFTREKQKIKTRILHHGGLDRYYGLVALAESAGLLKKVSTKYQFTDTGESAFEKTINKNPAKYWTQERLDLIDTYCKGAFMYTAPEADDDADD